MKKMEVCKLCCETYDDSVRPRCLPCGHSFCTSCVNGLIDDGKLSCANCKKNLYAVNASDFPINYDLEVNILNFKAALSSVDSEDDLKEKSKQMEILIDEQKNCTQSLIFTSEDLQVRLKEYDIHLLGKKIKYEEVLQKIKELTNRNENIVREIDNEHKRLTEMLKEFEVVRENVKNKLPLFGDATSAKCAITVVAKLDQSVALLEDWNESCQQQLSHSKSFTSEKVPVETMAVALSVVEKFGKIIGNDTLPVEMLQNMSGPLKNLMKGDLVYAVQSENGGVRCARLSTTNDKLYLHCLQDGKPPAHVLTVKHSDLVETVNKDSTVVFMDLSWSKIVQGRMLISLSPDTPLARQFRILCTGDLGPSYARSKFYSVLNKTQYNEEIYAGDYLLNNGNGGASVLQGLNKDDGLYTRPYITGNVRATQGLTDGPKSAQFIITTGNGNASNASNVFGQVQDGLDVVKAAAKFYSNCDVEIVDCGVVLSF